MCGCGKAYLSYPALYTHVKNKHAGVFPIGSNAKRKIPKNCDEGSENAFAPNIDKFYEDFREFLCNIPDASSNAKSILKKEEIENLFDFKIEGEEKELLMLKSAMKALIYLESDVEKFSILKNTMNIYQILAFYLISIYPFCTRPFFKEYMIMIILIFKSLNEKGSMFIERGDTKKQLPVKVEETRKQFCEGTNVHVISEILNLFIAELFPNFLKKIKSAEMTFEFLGFDDDHIKNLILMTKFVANWLYNQNFTDYRLEINVDL
jgi:hypothetical protein